jgi:hypothetical protein
VKFECSEQLRLRVVKRAGKLNGIEYLEVASAGPVQRTLLVRLLLKPAVPVKATEVSIEGGERIPSVKVEWAALADALPSGEDPAIVAGLDKPDQVLVVRTVEAGDFSYYTLRVAADKFDRARLPGQGLPEFPAHAARSAEPGHPALARAQPGRSRRDAGGTARLRR